MLNVDLHNFNKFFNLYVGIGPTVTMVSADRSCGSTSHISSTIATAKLASFDASFSTSTSSAIPSASRKTAKFLLLVFAALNSECTNTILQRPNLSL